MLDRSNSGSFFRTLAPAFQEVQLRVSSIVKNKILVGHCLWTFLSVRHSIQYATGSLLVNRVIAGSRTFTSCPIYTRPGFVSSYEEETQESCDYQFANAGS